MSQIIQPILDFLGLSSPVLLLVIVLVLLFKD